MKKITYKQFKDLINNYTEFDDKVLEFLYQEFGKDIINKYFEEYYQSLEESQVFAFIKKYSAYFEKTNLEISEKDYNENHINDIVKMLISNASRYPLMSFEEEKENSIILKNGKDNLLIINEFQDEILYPKLDIETILLSIKEKEHIELLKILKRIPFVLKDESILKENIKVIKKYITKFSSNIPNISKLKETFPELMFDNKKEIDINTLASQIELYRNYVTAANSFYNRNLRLVISIAKRHIIRGKIEFEDLIQEGNIGLIKAINKYDLDKECRFSTYATWWIKQLVLRAITDKSNLIRKPVYLADKLKKYEAYKYEYYLLNGVNPTIYECAENLELSEQEIKKLQLYSNNIISLEYDMNETSDKKREFLSTLADSEAEIEQKYVESEFVKDILKLIGEHLSENEMRIILDRFGINAEQKSYTLQEIAARSSVTRERIRQIEAKSLKKVRALVKMKQINNNY